MSLFKTFKMQEIDRFASSLIIGILYASSDEIHQCFVPGRGPLFTDVLLDTLGVLVGILFVMLIVKLYLKITNREKEETNKIKS